MKVYGRTIGDGLPYWDINYAMDAPIPLDNEEGPALMPAKDSGVVILLEAELDPDTLELPPAYLIAVRKLDDEGALEIIRDETEVEELMRAELKNSSSTVQGNGQ